MIGIIQQLLQLIQAVLDWECSYIRPVIHKYIQCFKSFDSQCTDLCTNKKERLAATWACEKFHYSIYLDGLDSFRLIRDHKPLVPIINSDDLNKVPLRWQRLLIRMMRYNPRAEYMAGKKLVVPDTLSRQPIESAVLPIKNTESENEIKLQEEITRASWPISDNKLDNIMVETGEDKELSDAIEFTINGWPKHIQNIQDHVRNCYEHWLLLYYNKIVIPDNMHDEILNKIHLGNQVVNKCMEQAEMCDWWPEISKDIKELVDSYEYCQEKRKAQRKEPLHTTEMPTGPWD